MPESPNHQVRRAVLVGNPMSPAMSTKPDGTVSVHCGANWRGNWAARGYAMVRSADEKAVSPGDRCDSCSTSLTCLILIDEWWPMRGSSTTSRICRCGFRCALHLAQTLSESAKLADRTCWWSASLVAERDRRRGWTGGARAAEERHRACGDLVASRKREEGFEIVGDDYSSRSPIPNCSPPEMRL